MAARSISTTFTPKIALNFDSNHTDPHEYGISLRLREIDPQKKIVFFAENRYLEMESLNQYSLELLSKDKPISTASSLHLLSARTLTHNNPASFRNILCIIYSDPYLKQLFIGKHYAKFNPQDFGLVQNEKWRKLNENNMTSQQINAIRYVEELFQLLDQKLPEQSKGMKEQFFDECTASSGNGMTNPNNFNSFDYTIFVKISEALAFMRIKQVHAELDPHADKTKELSLDMINDLHRGSDCEWKLWYELHLTFRTQFQADKVIRVVEKILSDKNSDPNTIFVVRDGLGHRDLLTMLLKQHFKNGDIKEIALTTEDLPEVEQKIQGKFFAATPSQMPHGVSGTLDKNDPSLQGLPVLHFA